MFSFIFDLFFINLVEKMAKNYHKNGINMYSNIKRTISKDPEQLIKSINHYIGLENFAVLHTVTKTRNFTSILGSGGQKMFFWAANRQKCIKLIFFLDSSYFYHNGPKKNGTMHILKI